MNLSPTNDDALVQRLKARDATALEELLSLHGGRLYGVALRLMRNETDAQEVLQDALISIWQKIDTFEARSAFPTWLHRVTVNAALMKLRKNKRFEQNVSLDRAGDDEPVSIQLPDPKSTPDDALLRGELGDRVRTAIEALPEPFRTTVILADVEELSMEEIAQVTGVSVPAAKSRLHRGRLGLRKALKPYLKELPDA